MPQSVPSVPLQLQPRDLDILTGLFESRIITAAHVADLHFNGSREAAKKRLQKIKAAALIAERNRRVNDPAVLFLTRKGFSLLRSHGRLGEYPSLGPSSFDKRVPVGELTLRHELEVMDVKSALYASICRVPRFKLAQFNTWPLLYEFTVCRSLYGGKETLVKPDGFIRIHETEADGSVCEHAFFLEVDRSSETQETLANRAGCYLDYYQSGGFAEWNGAHRDDYKEYPFRVLMVFKNDERRNNTAERLLQRNPPILTQVYMSTMAEVTTDPLGAIWIRPLDYRTATEGTSFEPDRQHERTYRRQPARELLIERKIKKLRLLED